jgi:hypothetical protein
VVCGLLKLTTLLFFLDLKKSQMLKLFTNTVRMRKKQRAAPRTFLLELVLSKTERDTIIDKEKRFHLPK